MSAAKKKSVEDDELTLRVEDEPVATELQSAQRDPENVEDGANRQGLIGSESSRKAFDPRRCNIFTHIKALIIIIVTTAIMVGFLVGVVFIRLDRVKCNPYKNVYLKKYEPHSISVALNENQQPLVKLLIEAASILDKVFLHQVWSGNEALAKKLKEKNDCSGNIYQYFKINYGPWSRVDDNSVFVHDAGVPTTKPAGANFYPEDMTIAEFDKWVESATPEEQEAAKSFYTTIRRENGNLKAVPYSVEYASLLQKASEKLTTAAELITNPSLKNYTLMLARAFETNNFAAADEAWLHVEDSDVVFIMGPYETYEDRLLNFKSAFGGYVGIKDVEGSHSLDELTEYLQDLEDHLPLNNTFKSKVGKKNSIEVWDLVYNSGEAKAAAQVASFNFPYNSEVIMTKGTRKVILKNIIAAKFENIAKPIGRIVMEKLQRQYIHEHAFFLIELARELAHGLGPKVSTYRNGTEVITVPVRESLEGFYDVIEEVKAEVGSVWSLIYLLNNDHLHVNLSKKAVEDEGELLVVNKKALQVTYLSNLFRTLRFGQSGVKAETANIIYNYLKKTSAILVEQPEPAEDEEESHSESAQKYYFSINYAVFEEAISKLLSDVLAIMAYQPDTAKDFVAKHSGEREEVLEMISFIDTNDPAIPVDIKPDFLNAHGVEPSDIFA